MTTFYLIEYHGLHSKPRISVTEGFLESKECERRFVVCEVQDQYLVFNKEGRMCLTSNNAAL